jgi:PIN domain nuclease of toxin-antitoxin system
MKLLLDTHTFIWWDSEPAELSPPDRSPFAVITECENFRLGRGG